MITTLRIRTLGVLLAAALTAALVPALPSLAAPAGTAELTAGLNVFPTASGESRDFTISVSNSDSVGGESIDEVAMTVPINGAGVSLTDSVGSPPSGWSASTRTMPDLHVITYEADNALSQIHPGATQSFTFPAEVARPQNAERDGKFSVSVSSPMSDRAQRLLPPEDGTLSTTVEILEVLNDVAVRSPSGATDGSATGGQTVTVGYSVRNHALDAVNVSGELGVDDTSLATPSTPVTQSVPGDPSNSTLFEHSVSTSAVSQNSTVTFDASASSTGADAEQNPTSVLELQVPSLITLDKSSFEPESTNSGLGTAGKQFTIDADKNGTPDLTISEGSLSFASTTATLVDGPYELSGSTTTLTFETTDEISGAQGLHDGTFTFPNVEDDNDYVDSQELTLTDLIDIDDIAPDLTVNVEIPEGQTAVKNGDSVRVYGTITGTDAQVEDLEVVLNPDIGESIPVSVSATETETGYTYEGTVEPEFEDGVPDGAEEEAHEDPPNPFAKSFTADASVLDDAGNLGSGSTDVSDTGLALAVDNVIPFLENNGRTGRDTDGNSIIRLEFEDNYPVADDIRGGCDPSVYYIDGTPGRVSEVRTPAGTCDNTASTSGTRILVLNYDLEEGETPDVTYRTEGAGLTGAALVNDGAINDALTRTIDTVVGIAPAPPEIIEVTRNEGSEPAYRDGEGYWTRFGGDDLIVTFGGFEDGYKIQVLDENNNVLKTSEELRREKVSGTNEDHPSEDGERTITVPIGTSDGSYVRKLRFLSSQSEAPPGVPEALTINLDTLVPEIDGVTQDGGDVTVSFNDQLVVGTDSWQDWFALEGDDYIFADEVTQPDGPSARLLAFTFEDPSLFNGVRYWKSDDTVRYEDRAGNTLADQDFPA